MSEKQIRVTVTDLKTGESESVELSVDYVLTTAGSCELVTTLRSSWQRHAGRGTNTEDVTATLAKYQPGCGLRTRSHGR